MEVRRKLWNKETKQIISYANINAESKYDKERIFCHNINNLINNIER